MKRSASDGATEPETKKAKKDMTSLTSLYLASQEDCIQEIMDLRAANNLLVIQHSKGNDAEYNDIENELMQAATTHLRRQVHVWRVGERVRANINDIIKGTIIGIMAVDETPLHIMWDGSEQADNLQHNQVSPVRFDVGDYVAKRHTPLRGYVIAVRSHSNGTWYHRVKWTQVYDGISEFQDEFSALHIYTENHVVFWDGSSSSSSSSIGVDRL